MALFSTGLCFRSIVSSRDVVCSRDTIRLFGYVTRRRRQRCSKRAVFLLTPPVIPMSRRGAHGGSLDPGLETHLDSISTLEEVIKMPPPSYVVQDQAKREILTPEKDPRGVPAASLCFRTLSPSLLSPVVYPGTPSESIQSHLVPPPEQSYVSSLACAPPACDISSIGVNLWSRGGSP